MRILWVLLLLFSACKKPESNYPHSKPLTPLKDPVVYARYETLPALLRTKPGPCAHAFAFRAPDPYRLRAYMDLCGFIGQKDPWQLPAGLQSFQWEQDLKDGEKLQLELIGPDGAPLPSTAQTSKTGIRMIVQLKTTENLPQDSILIIKATLLDENGKKLSSWNVPLKVSGT